MGMLGGLMAASQGSYGYRTPPSERKGERLAKKRLQEKRDSDKKIPVYPAMKMRASRLARQYRHLPDHSREIVIARTLAKEFGVSVKAEDLEGLKAPKR
jgi:hypothetical protein